jgi:hypothetical protein
VSDGAGIGVMTHRDSSVTEDVHRRLPAELAQRLLRLGRDLSPAATGARDFRDTAEIVAGLDLVVSLDTAVAHLAASMGKRTIVLAPDLGTYWTWRQARLWYPSAEVALGPVAWAEAVEAVAAEGPSTTSRGHGAAATP